MFNKKKKKKISVKKEYVENKTNDKRTLIIGRKIKNKFVKCYNWYDIPSDLNLADFHNVIIDFTTITEDPFPNVEKIEGKNIWNLIFNKKSQTIIIGRPENIHTSGEKNSYFGSYFIPLHLLPVIPDWTDGKGVTIVNVDSNYRFYFSEIKEWSFHFEMSTRGVEEHIVKNIDEALKLPIKGFNTRIHKLATNGYDKPLGCTYFFEGIDLQGRTLIESAPITWLPPVSEEKREDVIIKILNNIFMIESLNIEPEWSKEFRLPSSEEIKCKIDEINTKINLLEDEKMNLNLSLENKNEFNRLLFEQGTKLEEIVEKAVSELGCDILETSEGNNEDIQFKDPNGLNWIGEIKGRKGCLKRDDIRQLADWVNSRIIEEEWSGRAMIIGNYFCEENPKDRQNPLVDRESKTLIKFGFSLLKTYDLYLAICEKEKGKFNAEKFWYEYANKCKEF